MTGTDDKRDSVPDLSPDEFRKLGYALVEKAPLLSVPSGTTLAWAAILEAFDISRVVGTVLCSASAQGRHGVLALSQESIALFNQSDGPSTGPAGQAVAFDVIPGGGIDCERVQRECHRLFQHIRSAKQGAQ